MQDDLCFKDDVTLVTVNFGDPVPLTRNIELTARLNPGVPAPRWIVVDNSCDGACDSLRSDSVTVVEGVKPFRQTDDDRGSYHHAAGIMVGLSHVKSRFALIIDPDFYVIKKDWIERVVAHLTENQLAFFGSVWHPKWTNHPRYFPTVHFFLVDLKRVPREELDFIPGFCEDPFWNFYLTQGKARKGKSAFMKLLWRMQTARFRDTGWLVRKRFSQDPNTPSEVLTPSFRPPRDAKSPLARMIDFALPDRLSFIPRREGYFTTWSFLMILLPEAYLAEWEEFFWQDEPFAAHLRRVGRARGSETAQGKHALSDAELLQRFLEIPPERFQSWTDFLTQK